MYSSRTIEDINIGDSMSFSKTISEADVYLFAGITGDFNPVHVNREYARRTRFGERIAHGALTLGLAAPVLGMMLPGVGTVVEEIRVRFTQPVYIGDTITVTAKVGGKEVERNRVHMTLKWENQTGVTVAEGSAVCLPPRASSEKSKLGAVEKE